MKVALVGATGRIGSSIRAELLRRKHQVTAVSREAETAQLEDGVAARNADIFDPEAVAAAVRGHDAVVSAAMFVPGSSASLVSGLRRSGVRRAVIVGGAGSLEAGDGRILADVLELPAEWRPIVAEGVVLLDELRKTDDLDWTFVSPPAEIGPGPRTGKYRSADDTLVVDESGRSTISYDDYAIALVDALEKGTAVRGRFTVGY